MKAPPEVSVVVATRNRAERLEALLAGLRRQTLPMSRFEVIVVDDGSTDSTRELLQRERQRDGVRLTTLCQEPARGPATARNQGWHTASAAVIAFTDDDCVPTPRWLETLLAAAKGRASAIVRGSTVPNPAELDMLGPFAKTVDIRRPSPHFETCNVAYPRALLERIGGFDEDYPSPAGEDSDLGCRALAAGGQALFAPEARVHHAVFPRGPGAALRDAALAAEGVRAYKLNPELRVHLAHGLFYDRSHPLFIQAVCGLLLARRNPHAALLCLPYLRNVLGRARTRGARPWEAPFYPLFDAVQIGATLRGAVRNSTLII